jgi:hypothetical protein
MLSPARRGVRPPCEIRNSVLAVGDDAADVLAVTQVLIALVDLVERVALGDQLIEL